MRKIELLAPARNAECARAAIDCGADAVYIGGPAFGARRAASNTIDDIAVSVRYAHRYGARVYVALNTLLYESELDQAQRTAQQMIDVGADALIIQDMAYLRMGLGGVEFHASTQMGFSIPAEIDFLSHAGFSRIILERALSLDEIRAIRAATTADLECFVYGAICVGQSGRCFMSRSLSSRSGNRGECSQPCRLSYDLYDADGRVVIGGKHLLSMRDLDLSARIGELIDAGVDSFKIEGRLKDIDYVRNTVAWMRDTIDRRLANDNSLQRASWGEIRRDFDPDPDKSFTRPRSQYFIDGTRAGVAVFDTPKAMGEYMGRVTATGRDWFELQRGAEMSPADGICFLEGGRLKGTNINRIQQQRVTPNSMEAIRVGTDIYRNCDHRFTQQLLHSRTRRTIGIECEARTDRNSLRVRYVGPQGIGVEGRIEGDFPPADNCEKMTRSLHTALTKTGDTPLVVDRIEIDTTAGVPFITAANLNALRRQLLDQLDQKLQESLPPRRIVTPQPDYPFVRDRIAADENVINSLSEAFYRDHKVIHFDSANETADNFTGLTVMTSRYCLRRELGECLKERHTLGGALFLHHGTDRYRLDFDCANCRMKIVKL